jgi:hypothetical protein
MTLVTVQNYTTNWSGSPGFTPSTYISAVAVETSEYDAETVVRVLAARRGPAEVIPGGAQQFIDWLTA